MAYRSCVLVAVCLGRGFRLWKRSKPPRQQCYTWTPMDGREYLFKFRKKDRTSFSFPTRQSDPVLIVSFLITLSVIWSQVFIVISACSLSDAEWRWGDVSVITWAHEVIYFPYFLQPEESSFSLIFLWLIFPGGSDSKACAYNSGDPGSIPGSGRSPGEGNDNPLQYSCLENPMDGAAWWAAVHGVTKSRTRLNDWATSVSKSLRFGSSLLGF